MKSVAKTNSQEVQAQSASDTASIISVIDRAARDPQVDISKMERLMDMYERITSKQAEIEFSRALAELQTGLPSIGKRGAIKNKQGGIQSTYALWEDINDVIKPKLADHGFALSFRTESGASGVKVTGVLTHRGGHREVTGIILPADISGNKNAVQAVASSISYGKRYTAGALLNITSHGEDDDAQSAVMQEEQQQQPDGPVLYADAKFQQNLPSWDRMIRERQTTVERIAKKVASTGEQLTNKQLETLGRVRPQAEVSP